MAPANGGQSLLALRLDEVNHTSSDMSVKPIHQLGLGFDTHARLFKTVVIIASDRNELLIHVMKSLPALHPAPRVRT